MRLTLKNSGPKKWLQITASTAAKPSICSVVNPSYWKSCDWLEERLVLEVSRMLREDFLFQDAFSPDDAYTPLERQYGILKSIMVFYEAGLPVVTSDEFEFTAFTEMKTFGEVATLKDKLDWNKDNFAQFQDRVRTEISSLSATAA